MLCYHGTSIDFLESIQEKGLLTCPPNRVWNVSQDAVYFWCKKGLELEYDADDLDDETMIIKALDQALLSCAFAENATPICVEFEVADELVEEDQSCENMENANCVFEDVKPEQIRNIYIGPDLNLVKLFLMKMVQGLPMLENEFSSEEESILGCIGDDWYLADESIKEKLWEFTTL